MTISGPNNFHSDTNKQYIIIVIVLTFISPALGLIIEHLAGKSPLTFNLFCKWFIFFAVGVRLFTAGMRQTTNPAFTAREIFRLHNTDSFPILRELGFANLCFGLVGIISLFRPGWRIVSAFASGLYYGLAALQHLIKKPAGTNERFALWTDLLAFLVLAAYCIMAMR